MTVCWLMVFRGRLKHGRHFTFKSAQSDVAVTLVPCSVVGAIVSQHGPYAAHGPWLQVTQQYCITTTSLPTALDQLSTTSVLASS